MKKKLIVARILAGFANPGFVIPSSFVIRISSFK